MGRHATIKKLKFFIGLYTEVKDEIVRQITLRKSFIVLPCSLNDIANASLYPNLKAHYRHIDMCTTDGIPLVLWATLKIKSKVERVYGPSLTKGILIDTQGIHFRHVFCGTSTARLKKLMETILKIAPSINIVGSFSPRVQLNETKEEKEYVKEIIKRRPTILWIGISSPKQVVLASRWKRYFPHTTIFCVGAAFDLISGETPIAPSWLQYLGLEWLFRLIVEPRRLYKRYLFVIPRFLFHQTITWLRGYFFF